MTPAKFLQRVLPRRRRANSRQRAVARTRAIVIVGAVAYEGVDLQGRTRALDHGDLPWTPADLQPSDQEREMS